MSVNLDGVFYCMRAEIGPMSRAGGGSIVNMSSVLGSVGIENSPAYVASKHGVVGLTKAAALEHAAEGVRINAVGPGFVSTPLLEANLPAALNLGDPAPAARSERNRRSDLARGRKGPGSPKPGPPDLSQGC